MQLLCFMSHFRVLVCSFSVSGRGEELAQSRIILSAPPLSHLFIFFLLIYKLLKSAINPTSKAEKGISTRHSKGGPSDYNNPILLRVSLRGFSPCAECRNAIPLWACAPHRHVISTHQQPRFLDRSCLVTAPKHRKTIISTG